MEELFHSIFFISDIVLFDLFLSYLFIFDIVLYNLPPPDLFTYNIVLFDSFLSDLFLSLVYSSLQQFLYLSMTLYLCSRLCLFRPCYSDYALDILFYFIFSFSFSFSLFISLSDIEMSIYKLFHECIKRYDLKNVKSETSEFKLIHQKMA